MFFDASVPAPAHLAQDGVLARKIPKERGLTDFENLHDIVHASLLVAFSPEQFDGRLDNFLPEARLLALAQSPESSSL